MSKPRKLTALQKRWLAECERNPDAVVPFVTGAALLRRGLVSAWTRTHGYACTLTPKGREALREANATGGGSG